MCEVREVFFQTDGGTRHVFQRNFQKLAKKGHVKIAPPCESSVPVKRNSLWLRWQKNIKRIKMRQNRSFQYDSHFTLFFSEWPVGISGGGCVGQLKCNRRNIVRNSYVRKTCDAKSVWRRRTYTVSIWNIDANILICISTSKFYQM